jgi:hypothetical protein
MIIIETQQHTYTSVKLYDEKSGEFEMYRRYSPSEWYYFTYNEEMDVYDHEKLENLYQSYLDNNKIES